MRIKPLGPSGPFLISTISLGDSTGKSPATLISPPLNEVWAPARSDFLLEIADSAVRFPGASKAVCSLRVTKNKRSVFL
ncbi:hypothetical protein A3A09_00855 [Candidatus Nomurabacteria bacterium RIFCSPLOWO2_01_FULL_42_20]|uniref:Uncharacterized protein n=1 Tax=Candidatus Nomurabacteria bacterium RIFCSPHIGHO2_01_FULL_42_16 TaxID=1801743 RepID=A0A1F6VKE0_9BACT|nr:MAG: hypothetical protein A2824_02085 [Candidatus Nomurabacteria bacterium RIFCSPHIGHO2_01_FULL_42_16]OGI92437.1 MAG: hypothetical protein A3A09_00855 [Candidatus Nomurabacteria bacterium RIFCSPLOWO2_01_FULL_42_20]